ncbi:hypothetical protein Ct61P_15089 [Colletotrichum tofieldiae]|nr:hypothetical protein Ct61P_15089 [Colletotrichum tofieldiae]
MSGNPTTNPVGMEAEVLLTVHRAKLVGLCLEMARIGQSPPVATKLASADPSSSTVPRTHPIQPLTSDQMMDKALASVVAAADFVKLLHDRK